MSLFGLKSFDRATSGLSGYNQSDYTHYVIAESPDGTAIESGWSYEEDAKEHQKELLENGSRNARVFTKIGAKRAGWDPDDNRSWLHGALRGLSGQDEPEIYTTSYCNQGHRMKNGRPVGHECRVIPPAALRAERAGDYERAIEIMESKK